MPLGGDEYQRDRSDPEPDHRRERRRQDRSQTAARSSDPAESPVQAEGWECDRGHRHRERGGGQRSEVVKAEEGELPSARRARDEDVRAEELEQTDERRNGAPGDDDSEQQAKIRLAANDEHDGG